MGSTTRMLLSLLFSWSLFPICRSECQECLYIYDNSAANSVNQELWKKDGLQIGGVFLIKGSLESGKVELTFEKKDSYEVLTFTVNPGQLVKASGKTESDNAQSFEQAFSGIPSTTGDFTITFTVLPQSKFTIWYGDKGINSERLDFNYNKKFLAFSNDKQFYTVDAVTQKTANLEAIKFIYNCPLEKPGVCKGDGSTKAPYELLQNIILECRGTGIGPLSVSWNVETLNPSDNVKAARDSVQTQLDSITESMVVSRLTLTNFSLVDITKFVCTVSSSNSGGLTDSLEFNVDYQKNISFVGDKYNYFTKNQQDGKFVFYMEGWPLKLKNNYEVRFVMNPPGTTQTVSVITKNQEFLTANPPRIRFNADIQGKLDANTLSFEVKDITPGSKVLGTYSINRVGFGCKSGYYGIESRCVQCPNNGTSPAESDNVNNCTYSNCKEGFYGVRNDCTSCPDGKTSNPYSLKVEDCFESEAVDDNGDKKNTVLITVFTVVGVVILLVLIGAITFILHRARQRHHVTESVVTANRASAKEDHYDNHKLRSREEDQEKGQQYATLDREHYEKKKQERLDRAT